MNDEFDPEEIQAQVNRRLEEDEHPDAHARDVVRKRRLAYVHVFSEAPNTQGDVDIVVNDLARFCRAFAPLFDPKDGDHAAKLQDIKEGRREVFLRIKDFSELDEDQLMQKYHRPNP